MGLRLCYCLKNIGKGLLAWLLTQMRMEDVVHHCLNSLVRISRLWQLSIIFFSILDYELDAMIWWTSRLVPKPYTAHFWGPKSGLSVH